VIFSLDDLGHIPIIPLSGLDHTNESKFSITHASECSLKPTTVDLCRHLRGDRRKQIQKGAACAAENGKITAEPNWLKPKIIRPTVWAEWKIKQIKFRND
jgi:hypothetical protein